MTVAVLRMGFTMVGAAVAGQAVAAVPHPALAAKPVAAFTEIFPLKTGAPNILYYKNEDSVKTTSTTVKTPIYTSVTTPVYTTVKTPKYDSKGKLTGYSTTQVQTGTTTSQKLTGYDSVTTKSTLVTPKSEMFTTNGSGTTPSATMVKFVMDVPSGEFATALSSPQYALFSFYGVSTQAAVPEGSLLAQTFDSGTLSFKRATPLYHLDTLGHATGPALTNLLTVTFQNATLTATNGGSTIAFAAGTPASTIAFTSDFRDFSKADWLTNYDFALAGNAALTTTAMARLDPTLTNVAGARTLTSFRVGVAGTFAASDVPEPASWMLLVMGFGVIGYVARADMRKLARTTL